MSNIWHGMLPVFLLLLLSMPIAAYPLSVVELLLDLIEELITIPLFLYFFSAIFLFTLVFRANFLVQSRLKSFWKKSFEQIPEWQAMSGWYVIYYFIVGHAFTTNHKRIAVNYYWFVILSGSVGMGLATAIRFELAYPGLGIFAGDSLQYLSVVTAHGVIMVFFMIMPLLFGAFGNFLLPTQLGVHDVAFPRLNSAAFWFLPAGFLMLGQILCIDRRYQRMNCFNIREVQSLLKREFFSDLVNSHDHRTLLNTTMLNHRFKMGQSASSTTSFDNFNNYGTLFLVNRTSANNQYETLENSRTNLKLDETIVSPASDLTIETLQDLILNDASQWLNQATISKNLSTITDFDNLRNVIKSLPYVSTLGYFHAYNLMFNIYHSLKPWSHVLPQVGSENSNFPQTFSNLITNEPQALLNYTFTLDPFSTHNSAIELETKGIENNSNTRPSQLVEPLWRYDFRCGNYLKDNHHLHAWLNPVIYTTFANYFLPSWFITDESTDILEDLLKSNPISVTNANISNDFFSKFPLHDLHTTLLFSFDCTHSVLNLRWAALNNLELKFHNMFFTVPLQERIYSNWRTLKFSREAWRCKLLAARHQETLYRRYLSEESFMWSLERNAKDLLPGWAMVTPFSARTRYTAVGKTDLGLMGVFLVLNSSIVSSANFLVTYRYLSTLNNRKMRDARSFFTEGLMVASWMMIAANPMLAIGIMMLLSDRHWQTSFFDYSGGGDTVLFQHMFWFFGHPEVYVIMIPVFGFTNTILSYFLRKRISARLSLMYSLYTIAFLGFFVWGHHMYMVGLSHTTRMLFSTLTVMISVPAATKLMHWSVTLVNSSFTLELPLLFTFVFIFFFVSGGISGMAVAHTGMDILFHDSFYVIGHFHVMFAGAAMFGSFAAFYFYFPAILGLKFSRYYAYTHFILYLLGQFMTVVPMMWVGYAGMPRRILDYPASLGGWHSVISAGHLLSVAGLLSFFLMIADSKRQSRVWVPAAYLGTQRLNTRVLFYRYEINRHQFMDERINSISKANARRPGKTRWNYFKNNEPIDLTPLTYSYHI